MPRRKGTKLSKEQELRRSYVKNKKSFKAKMLDKILKANHEDASGEFMPRLIYNFAVASGADPLTAPGAEKFGPHSTERKESTNEIKSSK